MEESSSEAKGVSQLNQLGGTYINGRPLPNEVRHEIIALALQGFRPCDISRRLQITHGCISKLLSKYRKTGSIQAGGKGVGRPRVITPHLAEKIEQYTNQQPGIYSWEIRDRLVQENVCSIGNVPSLSSISRLLTYNRTASAAEGLQQSSGCRSHSIASILNLASTSESSTLSSSSSSVSSFSSLANNEGEMQDQQMRDNALDNEDSCFSSREVIPRLQTQKRERIKYTSDQLHELESAFAVNQYPSATERDHLAARLGVTESRIQVWFSNRRVKNKKRRHTIHETNFSTTEPRECTCRRNSEPNVHLRIMGPGRSRIFFPPGYE